MSVLEKLGSGMFWLFPLVVMWLDFARWTAEYNASPYLVLHRHAIRGIPLFLHKRVVAFGIALMCGINQITKEVASKSVENGGR